MKYITPILLALIFTSCSNSDSKVKTSLIADTVVENIINSPISFNLTGTWQYKDSSSTFDLELLQFEDSIKGNYCAIAYNGNKIDCYVDNNDDCYLQGNIIDNIINIDFKSCYVGATGQATIKYDTSTDQLLWKLGKVTADVYAPDRALLTRKK